jgi:hypothetical protein
MTQRLALLVAACALFGALAATPSFAGQSNPDKVEKQAAQKHAKRVLVRRAAKTGIPFRTSDVSASCKRLTDYWKCRAKANTTEGSCYATMRLYNAAGPFHASKVAIGCAEPAVTPDE